MKTINEVYRALADDETLERNDGFSFKIINDVLHSKNGGTWQEAVVSFQNPELYKIYKAPKWHEKDLSAGVWCRVRDREDSNWAARVVVSYKKNASFGSFITSDGDYYIYAEPLDTTKPIAPQLKF